MTRPPNARLVVETRSGLIYGGRYHRGFNPIRGSNTPLVGYNLACSECAWTQRVNSPLHEARKIGRQHLRAAHTQAEVAGV